MTAWLWRAGCHISRGLLMRTLKFVVLLFPAMAGCMGYVPGRQYYWDSQVREMCEKDGGMIVYERVPITKAQVESGVQPSTWTGMGVGRGDRRIGAPPKALARPWTLVYSEFKFTEIRDGNPSVSRTEITFVRSGDQSMVARYVLYGRGGGDFPSIAHPSSFSCPDLQTMASEINKLFMVIDENK